MKKQQENIGIGPESHNRGASLVMSGLKKTIHVKELCSIKSYYCAALIVQ